MFRDLKEYQEIQSIYESKVCISDEERVMIQFIEEQEFTQEELDYLSENIEEATTLIASELTEELQPLTEETIEQEDLQELAAKVVKTAAKVVGKGLAKKSASKAVAKSVGAKANLAKKAGGLDKLKALGKSAIDKVKNVASNVLKNPKVKGALSKGKELAKGALNLAKKSAPIAIGVGAVEGGIAGVKALRNKGKKPEGKPPVSNEKGDTPDAKPDKTVVLPDKKTETKPTQASETKPTQTPSAAGGSGKKMSQIEKDNRQRFGDKRVDMLKQKQSDFKAYRSKKMSKADFIKKYPKSQTAKDAYARKNPNSSQAMQNMSYEPEGTPIQETSGYDPIKNYHLANDLAKVYQKIYEPVEEKVDSTDAENYNALVEFIIKEEIVSTVEEADAIIAELDNELVESYLTEGVITEGLMDAVNRVKQGVGNVAKKVGTAASGAMNKAKEVAGNVRDRVKTAVQTKIQQGRDLKSGGVDKLKQGNQLRQKTQAQTADVAKKTEMSKSGDVSAQSGGANDPGAARAKLQFLKNKREKMNNPNQKQLSGRERAQAMARERLAAKESVEKDAYTVVLEYLLDQKHAATIEEANYIMTELDTETIQGIISES